MFVPSLRCGERRGSRARRAPCAVAWLQGDLPPASGLEPLLAFSVHSYLKWKE